MVDSEEEEEEEEGLEYETDTPSRDSYMTPPSTRGHSEPSPCPTCLLTLGDLSSDTIFTLLFCPFSTQLLSLSLPSSFLLMIIFLMSYYSHEQTTRTQIDWCNTNS